VGAASAQLRQGEGESGEGQGHWQEEGLIAWHHAPSVGHSPRSRRGGRMLATDGWMVLLRIVHIGTGVIWVGSLFVVVVFIQPTAGTLGPEGSPFMSELRRRRFVDVVFVDAVFTVLAGAF